MPLDRAGVVTSLDVSPEEQLRADLYSLLAGFLSMPPQKDYLARAANMQGDESVLGQAVEAFSQLAATADAEDVRAEYHDLFIGVARGELLPYASYYLTGFLNEKPLAKLRNDMTKLGIRRDPSVREPEDHIAALMDMMSGLITGKYGEPLSIAEQKRFFERHIGSWAGYFFADLEAAKSSVLYASLATIGRHFIEIEEAAFSIG